MSRLSECQIRSMIDRMEAGAWRVQNNPRRLDRLQRKLAAYRAELALKTGHVDRFETAKPLCLQQTDVQNFREYSRFGGSMEAKNALTVAGEHIQSDPSRAIEIGKWIGRRQAFGMMAASCSAADAQCLKRIKDTAEYKSLGLTWEQFCVEHLGADRKTIERIIANLEEYGAAYFNLRSVVRISPGTYNLIAGAIDENSIEFDGEKIPITKANADRICQAVAALRRSVETKDEHLKTAANAAKKLKEERDMARKGVDRAREEFEEYKRKQAERFPDADADHSTLLDAQSLFDLAMAKLTAIGNRDVSEENQARYIALCEYMYRALIQATHDAREKYGKGWNMADPTDLLTIDQVTPDARNLVADHAAANRKKN